MDDHTRLQAADEIPLRTLQLLDALVNYDRSKGRYQRRRGTLVERYPDRGDFLVNTRDDQALREAAADCAWYGSEVQTLGTAVLALTAVTR